MPFHIETEKRGFRCPYGMAADAHHVMQGSLVLYTYPSLDEAQIRLRKCFQDSEGIEERET